MKESVFEYWIELLSDTEITDRTREEMIKEAANMFFPNINEDSNPYKIACQIIDDWYTEFENL